MKFSRIKTRSEQLLEFCEEALHSFGAVCERSWYDRLEVLAEGETAHLLETDVDFFSGELRFHEAGLNQASNTGIEVFPGCPLVFRLVETLWRRQVSYSKVCLSTGDIAKTPANDVAERLWYAQFRSSTGWRATPFVPDWAFSIVAAVRCEVQAIDQTWSYHRLGFSLPSGDQDSSLESVLEQMVPLEQARLEWPELDLGILDQWIGRGIQSELAPELSKITERQQLYLRRELTRIDDYFENYSSELRSRMDHQKKEDAKQRYADRLEATQAEHRRRRADQIERHTIMVIPHVDALLTVAEPAFRTTVSRRSGRDELSATALFVPRTRRWHALSSTEHK
jgi:hypothetical protein